MEKFGALLGVAIVMVGIVGAFLLVTNTLNPVVVFITNITTQSPPLVQTQTQVAKAPVQVPQAQQFAPVPAPITNVPTQARVLDQNQLKSGCIAAIEDKFNTRRVNKYDPDDVLETRVTIGNFGNHNAGLYGNHKAVIALGYLDTLRGGQMAGRHPLSVDCVLDNLNHTIGVEIVR